MDDDEDTGPRGSAAEFEIKQYDHERGSTYVRRIAVVGGWPYQTLDGSIQLEQWSQPVFVPRAAHANPSELIAEMLTS